jgi:DNA polymerase III sliding clamp (beta) subunit (PCNA family)
VEARLQDLEAELETERREAAAREAHARADAASQASAGERLRPVESARLEASTVSKTQAGSQDLGAAAAVMDGQVLNVTGLLSLDAHLRQAVLLKKVADALRYFCKDVNIDCSKKGIRVMSMDSSGVLLVSLVLRASAFSQFKCDRPTSLGVNVELLSEILKGCSPQDTLKIQWRADLDTVRFQCERGEDRIVEFDLKLMQVESDRMGIPERDYKVVAKLPSSEFQRICYDLQVFGDTMQIKASAEGITFSVQGDVGSG